MSALFSITFLLHVDYTMAVPMSPSPLCLLVCHSPENEQVQKVMPDAVPVTQYGSIGGFQVGLSVLQVIGHEAGQEAIVLQADDQVHQPSKCAQDQD